MIIIIIIKGVMIVLPFLLHSFLCVLFFPSWQIQVHVTRLLETNFIFHDYLSIIEDHVVISNTILVNIIIVAYPEVICNMLLFFHTEKPTLLPFLFEQQQDVDDDILGSHDDDDDGNDVVMMMRKWKEEERK